MSKDKIYKVGKLTIGLTLFVIFAIGLLLDITIPNYEFMENPITRRILAILVFLLGAHILCFIKKYAQDETARMERFLSGKPKIIQLWLGVTTSHSYNRILYKCIGVGALLWGILFFIATFADK